MYFEDISTSFRYTPSNIEPFCIVISDISIFDWLNNILSNSCKYSIDDTPTVNIEFENDILTIKDNGKGIKYPQKIFERNYKEANNGHGIGMHIVYRLCDNLSHKIKIKSEENIGTTIYISIK